MNKLDLFLETPNNLFEFRKMVELVGKKNIKTSAYSMLKSIDSAAKKYIEYVEMSPKHNLKRFPNMKEMYDLNMFVGMICLVGNFCNSFDNVRALTERGSTKGFTVVDLNYHILDLLLE